MKAPVLALTSALAWPILVGLIPARPASAAEPPPADVVPFAGLSPQDACDKATLPPGFKMHVFAAEPDVVQPIAFSLDHRSRVWVAEGLTYPVRRGKPPEDTRPAGSDRSKPTPEQLKDIFGGADRILIFEDTDGDNKADKRSVFLENLNLVSGLEVGFGGVWIGAAPYLLFVPVKDWDHPAPAGDPQILLDGWNYWSDTHEVLNTFSWGPDGWLYGDHGVFCPSYVGKPGAPESERQWVDAGIWRYHPIRHQFEIFTEGGSNPWGFDFDEHGQAWAEMCVIPHLFHMVQGARILRQGGQHYCVNADETARNEAHRDTRSRKPVYPYAYADIQQSGDHVHWSGNAGPHAANARSAAAGGGHAHAGMMVYLGDSWPDEYRGKLIMGNIHGQRLNMDIPERRGSGFVGHHGKDFINFNDSWSQTLNQRYDQDGSVYVIDWYDANQCHHGRIEGHDRSNGRIYKVVYDNTATSKIDLFHADADQLLGLQFVKNDWPVRQARQVLLELTQSGKPSARDALTQVRQKLLEALDPDQTGVVPAWYASLKGSFKNVRPLDDDARLRALWAYHVTGPIDEHTALKLLKNQGEYIRAWTIQLVCENKSPTAAELKAFARLAREDPSPVVRLYLASALQRIPPEQRRDVGLALLKHGEDANDHNLPLMVWFAMEPLMADHPREGLAAALETPLPYILNFTTRRIASIGTETARDLIAQQLSLVTDSAKQRDMLSGLSDALQGRRSVPRPAGWETLETQLSRSRDPDVRTLAETLSLTFGSPKARAALRRTLSTPGAPLESREAALKSLQGVKDPDLPDMLRTLLKQADLRGAALRALAGYNDPKTPEAILDVYAKLDPDEKRDALSTLVSRQAYAKPLLDAIAASRVPVKDLTADIVRQLRNVKDAAIQKQVETLYGAVRETSAGKKAQIERYRRIYWAGGSQPGNAYAGRVVFNKVCAQCHTLFDSGGQVGPNITGANRGDLNYLLETIIDPNAVIPNEYRSTEIETKDGRVLTGIVKAQDAKSVTIQTANELLILPKNEIETQRQTELSMMPEDLLTPLTDQEVRDLLYYLSRVGQVPLPATTADAK
jgi:putative membrane-bound dehydrogenase-like protein